MDSRAVHVWTAKKQKRKYISGIAAMTAGQILVIIIFVEGLDSGHCVKVITIVILIIV